jgi:hypothetical protein
VGASLIRSTASRLGDVTSATGARAGFGVRSRTSVGIGATGSSQSAGGLVSAESGARVRVESIRSRSRIDARISW